MVNTLKFDDEKVKLFCLPFAGGTASVYAGWKRYLHQSIELIPVELAGRGIRIKEPCYKSVNEAINDIYVQMKPYLSGCEYALFGHSMGGLLAYEMYYFLKKTGHKMPKHIFISGKAPVHMQENDKLFHTMPDDEFINEIYKLGGTQTQVFAEKQLLNLFLPILRNDFKITETYSYLKRQEKISCDISIFYGSEDSMVKGDIREWEIHSQGKCNFYEFNGGHFFINDYLSNVISIVNEVLSYR